MVYSAVTNSELPLTHPFLKTADVMASISPSMSHPQNLGNTRKFLIKKPKKTVVRALEQMKRPETKTVDKHYIEGKPTCTEVSKLPYLILIVR